METKERGRMGGRGRGRGCGGKGHGRGRGMGRGRGGFRGGFMAQEEGLPRGRKLSSGELQLYILALLEERSAHGYELIRAIEEKSGGFYVPSPGVIYPALTYLNEIGYAEAQPDGNRKLYAITDLGRAYLDENRDVAQDIQNRLSQIAERMDNVRAAFVGEDELAPDERKRFAAMGRIKRALKAKRDCSPEEAERIAAILNQAADDILKPAQ